MVRIRTYKGTEDDLMTNNVLRVLRALGVINGDVFFDSFCGPMIDKPGYYTGFYDIGTGDWR